MDVFQRFVQALLVLAACMATASAHAASLPDSHDYQKALRGYLATLDERDFEVELKPLEYVPEYFEDDQTVARYWMLSMEEVSGFPSSEGIRVPAKHFTLAAIESGDTVNMSASRGTYEPINLAWWAQWDYPGNPYRGNRAVKLRAFVAATVDMMMLDQAHDRGEHARSDYLGGSMIRFAYTWQQVKDAVSPDARKAYEMGLARMFEKLEAWHPRGSGGSDMEFFQLVGMWYAGQALGGDYPERALKRAHVVIDTVTSATGYEKHGGAFDVSYQGIALRFLAWAAMLYDDEKIDQALHKMLVLKSHLSLPEPHGRLLGPTHFSTGTHMDAPRDQWAWPSRDAAMAMREDEALYTIPARVGVPTIDGMRAQVRKLLESVKADGPADTAPAAWKDDHWTRGINYAFEYYDPAFYGRLVKLKESESPLLQPPFGRDEAFIRDLNGGGELLAARFDDYGVVIHTGAIATKWASGVSGKSGGSLSAFWTPGRGAAVLGLTRATQSDTPDEWTDANSRGPYTWAVHAITGIGKDGHYFSTSRLRETESEYAIDRDARSGVVTVSGDLAPSLWGDPNDQLAGEAVYRRTFAFDAAGLTISSALSVDADQGVKELWEMLPLYLGDSNLHHGQPPASVSWRVDGQWRDADAKPVHADRVRLRRFDAQVDVAFETPTRMKLSPDLGDARIGSSYVRNLMIDLLADQRDGKGSHAVTYRIVVP